VILAEGRGSPFGVPWHVALATEFKAAGVLRLKAIEEA